MRQIRACRSAAGPPRRPRCCSGSRPWPAGWASLRELAHLGPPLRHRADAGTRPGTHRRYTRDRPGPADVDAPADARGRLRGRRGPGRARPPGGDRRAPRARFWRRAGRAAAQPPAAASPQRRRAGGGAARRVAGGAWAGPGGHGSGRRRLRRAAGQRPRAAHGVVVAWQDRCSSRCWAASVTAGGRPDAAWRSSTCSPSASRTSCAAVTRMLATATTYGAGAARRARHRGPRPAAARARRRAGGASVRMRMFGAGCRCAALADAVSRVGAAAVFLWAQGAAAGWIPPCCRCPGRAPVRPLPAVRARGTWLGRRPGPGAARPALPDLADGRGQAVDWAAGAVGAASPVASRRTALRRWQRADQGEGRRGRRAPALLAAGERAAFHGRPGCRRRPAAAGGEAATEPA